MAGPLLRELRQASNADVALDELRHEANELIHRSEDLDALFDVCTTQLARLLGCRYASIFTSRTDSRNHTKLILRKTTYSQSRIHENSVAGAYSLDEEGLTPWIARRGVSICLQDLDDEEIRDAKLRSYDPALVWKNKVRDSDQHGDFLGVPILSANGEALGVLRFTMMHIGHFTQDMQRMVEKIARRYIAPRLQYLQGVEASKIMLNNARMVNTLAVHTSAHFGLLKHHLCSAMRQMFPERVGDEKLYVFNYLNRSNTRFRHVAFGGTLGRLLRGRASHSIDGTFTRFIIERGDEVSYFSNIPEAVCRGLYRNITPRAVCGLGCRVASYGRVHGAIIVLSDRFDLDPLTHGAAMQMLASKTAETLTRLQLVSLFQRLARFSSEEVNVQNLIQEGMAADGGFLASSVMMDLFSGIEPSKERNVVLSDVVRTVVSSSPYPAHYLEFDVSDTLHVSPRVACGGAVMLLNILQQAWEITDHTRAPLGGCQVRTSIDGGKLKFELFGLSSVFSQDAIAVLLEGNKPDIFYRGLVESRRLAENSGGDFDWSNETRSLVIRLPLEYRCASKSVMIS